MFYILHTFYVLDEIVKKIKNSDQVVKDENGRRRFHGAFTGGFSAGYFNTVGSSEGWTPTTFKSSRDSKTTPRTQNVYDFFDEEVYKNEYTFFIYEHNIIY